MIRMFRKPALEGPTTAAEKPARQPAQTARWTNGSVLGSKAVGVVVLIMWFCAPLSWFVASHALTVAQHANGGRVAPVASSVSPIEQTAGAFAVGFVGAWLSATTNDSTQLSEYVASPPSTLPSTPFAYRDIAIASVVPAADSHMVKVMVAANVEQTAITGNEQTSTWPRRYFQVIVNAKGSSLVAMSLPAPVAGPQTSTNAPNLGYGQTLSFDSSASQMVTQFFGAYLAGNGATVPFTTPNTSIPAISPAPYAQVTPVSYLATVEPSAHPSAGSTLGVLATLTAQTTTGHQITATYVVQMQATSGRWQVKSLDSLPVAATSSTPSQATTPSPTGGSK